MADKTDILLFAILQKYDFSSKSQQMAKRWPLTHVVCDTAKVRFFKQITTKLGEYCAVRLLFAILQKYDFSSKSQPISDTMSAPNRCLRYCKSTIFQANHNKPPSTTTRRRVVCDTAKVRFFKQITTAARRATRSVTLFAILQKYDFSSKSQPNALKYLSLYSCLRYCKSTIFQANHNQKTRQKQDCNVVCDTAKVRFFKQITTGYLSVVLGCELFAILQKYDFSSKSQHLCSLRRLLLVVCDTAKVRFFKQITTNFIDKKYMERLFAILQKYDFSSKSQPVWLVVFDKGSCLRYCKSTIFQANHNLSECYVGCLSVVCDTAKVRFFKQITTFLILFNMNELLFAILQKYDFSSKSQLTNLRKTRTSSCLRYCKSTIFQANHNQVTWVKLLARVVCDTAKVRFFKQITTYSH